MDTDNKFVEVDGVKYKKDPENEGEALIGDDGEFVPFEEKPEETQEEKETREKKETEEKKAEEDREPLKRRSVESHIIDRKNKKIEKLEKKKDKEDDDADDFGGGDGTEEVTREGKNAIKKQVKEELEPVLNAVRTNSDDQELKEVFAKYPTAKKMEKQIRKYMEAYPNPSVEFIYLGLAAKQMDLQKKRDKADEDAKADGTGGHGKRKKDLSPIPDVRDMPAKEFDELVIKVKTGQA